jgi:predicted nucleic acid-binding protein
MLVVSDSTPLNVLVRTDLVGILTRLYQMVVIPPAVR